MLFSFLFPIWNVDSSSRNIFIYWMLVFCCLFNIKNCKLRRESKLETSRNEDQIELWILCCCSFVLLLRTPNTWYLVARHSIDAMLKCSILTIVECWAAEPSCLVEDYYLTHTLMVCPLLAVVNIVFETRQRGDKNSRKKYPIFSCTMTSDIFLRVFWADQIIKSEKNWKPARWMWEAFRRWNYTNFFFFM